MTPTARATVATTGWRKSSHSGDEGACVELAVLPGIATAGDAGCTVAVRDSKDPDGPVLVFPGTAWTAFASAPPGT